MMLKIQQRGDSESGTVIFNELRTDHSPTQNPPARALTWRRVNVGVPVGVDASGHVHVNVARAQTGGFAGRWRHAAVAGVLAEIGVDAAEMGLGLDVEEAGPEEEMKQAAVHEMRARDVGPGPPAAAAASVAALGQHQVAEECLEPWRYICKTPGKNVRSKMIDCFQEWLRIPEDKLPIIKQIVGSLHNASLLIDDIEDDSKLRRGQPVAHLIYGIPQTLNCANYVYFMAMEKCLALQNPFALQVFTLELLNLHRGQGRELLWRDTGKCPSEDDYLGMIMDKTGGLFRLGVGLMQSFSESRTDFSKLVNLLSIYFQVRDDLINLASSSYHRNKSFCEDLTEGKFSFPIIHGIKNSEPGDNYLLSILKQRTENVDLKRSFVDFLRTETRSFAYTKQYLDRIFQDIQQEISAVGGSQHLMTLMEKLREEVDDCDV
ncbi:Geranylgeranyl pyrophosphate synthase [Hondaea fermentalgiana]|uniref:Geranylgeranyl pyrophosphate synthase n=1 Tax=Hondaea fermentalgiana TaxID=2315210 RepID=A0A2R5GBW5_9STRA|nr:Geranylgeranyl pyrophosphate synthase [Hondaea fermentalgiana]|eukprot:GBG27829.1 Geranylgeranyl pyrophosphate synthase [Hondaea fermentalgiana]